MNETLRYKLSAAAAGGAMAIAGALVTHFEGYESIPYRDVAGVLTVCCGHTGPDIAEGRKYSRAECEALLKKDLAIVQQGIDPVIQVPLPEATRAALYSFTYNVGVGAFKRSTLLKKLNAGDVRGACVELHKWKYAGGQVWKGLVTRRQIEQEVCSWRP